MTLNFNNKLHKTSLVPTSTFINGLFRLNITHNNEKASQCVSKNVLGHIFSSNSLKKPSTAYGGNCCNAIQGIVQCYNNQVERFLAIK